MSQLNIYQRINEVRKKISYVQKNAEVQGYRAVTHDDVTGQVRNHLIDQGIIIVPRLLWSKKVQVGSTKNGAPIFRHDAWYEVDFVNCDDPSDRITVPVESNANDHGDKAPGKAMSYATKYAMLKLFNIETGENEESRNEGYQDREPISDSQASRLTDLILASETDEAAFLKWIGAESVDKISVGKYGQALTQLERKVKAASKADKAA